MSKTVKSKNKLQDDIFGDESESPTHKNDFESMLEASLGSLSVTFEKGAKVEAQVMTIGKEEIFVSVQSKDGVVSRSELLDDSGLLKVKVGDMLTLFVIKTKDNLVWLTTKASNKALSETLEEAFDFETSVEGKVTEVVNGGFRVEVFHKSAFCPLSQMDIKKIINPEEYVGKKFEFIITKFEAGGRNVVVSRRKLLDTQRVENEGSFMETHKPGDTVTGKITRMENFGAFVDLGSGMEGLIHISEVGWSRLQHPSEALQLGETVMTKVLKIEEDDKGRLRISLSKKQATDDPWFEITKTMTTGTGVEGKIKEKAHFGWLIELKPGVVGLLPKSALKEATDEKSIEQKKPGDSIRLVIGNISPTEKRISLSLPRDQDDTSWQEFSVPAATKAMGTLGDQFSGLFSGGKKR